MIRNLSIYSIMKKLSIIAFAAAALALAACTQERNIVPAEPGLTTITAGYVTTRSEFEVSDGETVSYTILWSAPDSILVGYAGTTPGKFVSNNSSPAQEATFTGKLPEGSGNLCGIYPAKSGNTVNSDGTFSIAFKAEQEAVAGGYDPEALLSVAVSDSKNLCFQNVCGMIALSVYESDITQISVKEYTGNPIPGGVFTVEVGSETTITNNSEELDEVILKAPAGEVLSPGAVYYLVFPPMSFPEGVYFDLTHSDGNTSYDYITAEGNPKVERSKVHAVRCLGVEPYNGHEYVDLDLPSGLKWATLNIDAENVEDFGRYVAWAEIETKHYMGTPPSWFGWDTYIYIPKEYQDVTNNYRYITNYTCDDGQTDCSWYDSNGQFIGDGALSLGDPQYNYKDDVARQVWGGAWRIPTKEEWEELFEYTDIVWYENYQNTDTRGITLTSKKDSNKSIFIPAAGFWWGTLIDADPMGHNQYGCYWTSSLDEKDTACAWGVGFYTDGVWSIDETVRSMGQTVRPVVY